MFSILQDRLIAQLLQNTLELPHHGAITANAASHPPTTVAAQSSSESSHNTDQQIDCSACLRH